MTMIDETAMSAEARTMVDTAHQFAEEVLRPAGAELDRLGPAEVIAEGSTLWKVFDRFRELGLHDITSPGMGLAPAEAAYVQSAVAEELGWGDAGLAISLAVSGFHRIFANLSGNAALIDRFASPTSTDIGCWAITEPDHGSDSLAFTEGHFHDPEVHANCIATLDGDSYVIRGQKAAWVSNGTIATVATLFCTIDPSQGFQGGGVCLVPLDQPGVSRGAPLDKLGQRALNQGEIFFEDVRIPAEYMVVGKEVYASVVEMVLAVANAHMASTFVGVARAAFEHANFYAHERIQGGRPIFEHQSVRSRLFKMFMQTEAARSLARRVAGMGAMGIAPPVQFSIAGKVFCTSTAFEVASAAVQVYGGNGLSREYPVEKLLRDARASMIEDGCNEMLSLVGGAKL